MDWTDILGGSEAGDYAAMDMPASDAVASAVPDSNVTGSDLGTLDNPNTSFDSQPISSQSALEAALSGGQDNSPYSPPSNDMQQMAAPAAPAAGPVAQAFNAAKDSQLANEQTQAQSIAESLKEQPGVFSQLMKGLGVSGDLGNPRNLESMMKLLMGAGNIVNTLNRKGTAQNGMTLQQMRQMAQPNGSSFNPQQQAMADKYFNTSVGDFASRPRLFAGN